MALTQEQINDIQGLTANVETASRALGRSKTALSYLIQLGQASCNDIKSFNLMVKSTYFYQKSIADIIKASGGTAPDIQAPVYVAYKGATGDKAVDINCEQSQMRGWIPTGLGDFYVNPKDVEWRQGATPSDVTAIANTLAIAVRKQSGSELGAIPLAVIVPIILWGIVITITGYIVIKIVEALTDVPAKREYTKQVAITAERHAATMEARQKCMVDCLARGRDQTECAKNCSRLNPEFQPPSYVGGLGIIGKIVIGVALLGVLFIAFKLIRRRYLEGAGPQELPPGDDDAYEYGDALEGVIDAEYEEG